MRTRERIFYLLDKKHKSQSQLARHLNLSRQRIFQWKTEESLAFYKYINEIAEFLEVSPEYLLGTSDDENAKPTKLTKSSIEFALNNPSKFDDDVYEDVKAYSKHIAKKYKYKNVT